ncbi:hypothetical protein [Leifsonia sp. AG29]|uniref:hypothetical protein n=1 Tax=Leifsonia sp. AG29 TaxID=2598860 RepID=UPI00131DC449|nr:hypothetical protein [Leifsonia sp. AG29]
MSVRLMSRGATGAAWIVSGAAFALYPALRPFSSETGLEGARAFGSALWLVAHLSAIVAFAALLIAATGTYAEAWRRPVSARVAWLLQVVGVCLIFPFYGAEAYGLHALGVAAQGSSPATAARLVALASDVRGGVGLLVFLTGALCVAVGAVVGIFTTRPRSVSLLGSVLVAVALVLLVPQFFVGQPLRVAHGLLYLAGAVVYGIGVLRERRTSAPGGAGSAAR